MNIRQGFFIGLILVVAALTVLMFLPFFAYIIAAGILAYVLYPAQDRLNDQMNRTLAAAVLTVFTILAVIVPVVVAGALVAEDAQQIVQKVQKQDRPILDSIDQRVAAFTGGAVRLQKVEENTGDVSSGTAETVTQIAEQLLHIGIGLPILVILEFYALRDGKRLVEWTKKFEVIPTDMQNELYQETGNMVTAVVKGHIFMAVIQGIAIGIGLWLTGIPNPMFWTFIAVFFGLIPFIGVLGVWIPASIYLAVTGNMLEGVLLFLYGVLISGIFEDIARPLIVKRDMPIHEAFVLIGVIGGIFVFGAIGVFIGPVLFGMLAVLLEMFDARYKELSGLGGH